MILCTWDALLLTCSHYNTNVDDYAMRTYRDPRSQTAERGRPRRIFIFRIALFCALRLKNACCSRQDTPPPPLGRVYTARIISFVETDIIQVCYMSVQGTNDTSKNERCRDDAAFTLKNPPDLSYVPCFLEANTEITCMDQYQFNTITGV